MRPPTMKPWPISSPFGPRVDPITGSSSFHHGVDLRCPSGTVVVAVAAGTIYRRDVANDGNMDGNGIALWLREDSGRTWGYLHLSSVELAVMAAPARGQTGTGVRVREGQVLGSTGNTGRSTGPHLHLECHVDGVAVDPAPILWGRILKLGSHGQDVGMIQESLGVTVDGDFGPETEAAVRAWQTRHGLVADGVIGPMTRAAGLT